MASRPIDASPAIHDAAIHRDQGRRPADRRKPLPRDCPGDFDEMFVALGRSPDGCEAHYKCRRDTITRWLVERGKERLIEARAAYVAELRARGEWITRATNLITHRKINVVSIRASIRDERKVNPAVAREAAQFLRIKRNAGLMVSPADEPGTWWVGTRRLSAAAMVELARAKGFDDRVDSLGEKSE